MCGQHSRFWKEKGLQKVLHQGQMKKYFRRPNCKSFKSWRIFVGVRGFEPPTPASRRRCSTRLSYTPNDKPGFKNEMFLLPGVEEQTNLSQRIHACRVIFCLIPEHTPYGAYRAGKKLKPEPAIYIASGPPWVYGSAPQRFSTVSLRTLP